MSDLELGLAGSRASVRAARSRALHAELVRYDLVVWTGGNVSARVPGADLFVIKPSGVGYDELAPDEHDPLRPRRQRRRRARRARERSPSSDTAAHAYVYRNMPEVGGVVHTHSTYATAWAARGEAIPCVITAMADEFGGEIPVGPFAIIGDDSIGRGIVATLDGHRSPRRADAEPRRRSRSARTRSDAVKAAVMVEDVARTVHLARQLGDADPHPAGRDRRALRPLPERLRPAATTREGDTDSDPQHRPRPRRATRSGSSPAARTSTARRRCARSPSSRRQVARALGGAADVPVHDRLEAGAHGRRRHPPRRCSRRTPTTPSSA